MKHFFLVFPLVLMLCIISNTLYCMEESKLLQRIQKKNKRNILEKESPGKDQVEHALVPQDSSFKSSGTKNQLKKLKNNVEKSENGDDWVIVAAALMRKHERDIITNRS